MMRLKDTESRPTRRWNTKNEILLNAVIKGQVSTVKRLVERSFTDIDSKNPHAMSCLQLAIIHGHYKLAEYLIHRGIDIHSVDSFGWTALHDAALRNTKSIARKLVAKGASLTCTNNLGEIPIDVASSVELEELLCGFMGTKGEERLARQYRVYLGLDFLDKTREFGIRALEGSQARRFSDPRPQLPPGESSNSNASQNRSSASMEVGSHSNVDKDSVDDVNDRLGSQPNDHVPDAEVESSLAGSSREVGDGPTHALHEQPSISRSTEASDAHLIRRDFSYSGSLCISKDDLVQKAAVPFGESPLLPCLHQRSFAPSPRPTRVRRVSFAQDIVEQSPDHMARTKSVHSSASGGRVPLEKPILEHPVSMSASETTPQRPLSVSAGSSFLSPEELKRLNGLYDNRCESIKLPSSSDSEGSTFDSEEAISKLKLRPRKSSIAAKNDRRHSEPGKRRSVSFQPEVLLQDIVTVGDVKEVRQVLQSGLIPDVNKMSPAGLTALHQSAVDGNLECAEMLVRNGANVNSVDCEQWTPLHAAAMSGHTSLVQFLLSSGADPSLKNEEGDTPYDVAKNGTIRKLLLCAMNGKNPDGDDFSDEEYSGEEEEEYSHAESDSDSDEGENAGSPLFGSSKSSLKERLGLSSSAKILRESSTSPSPDMDQLDNVFTTSPEREITSTLRKERELSDSVSSYGSLFEQESEVSGESDNHLLHRPQTRSVDVEKVSEDQGISTMEGSSDCGLRSRLLSDDEGTARDVLDSELGPRSLDYKFQEAVLNCNVDTVHKLVRHKDEIDVNRVNKSSGITALHHAVLEENFALVQHLVKDFGAELNIKDRDGWTPLHAASAVGNICIAQYLLDGGAKPSILNSQCEFPVDVAEDESMEKLLKNAMLGPSVGKTFSGVLTSPV